MRLTPEQAQTIKRVVQAQCGPAAQVRLFGSRLQDLERGGDVDLYVEAPSVCLMNEVRCKVRLQDALDLPVDLLVRPPGDNSILARHAREQGVLL